MATLTNGKPIDTDNPSRTIPATIADTRLTALALVEAFMAAVPERSRVLAAEQIRTVVDMARYLGARAATDPTAHKAIVDILSELDSYGD